MGSPCRARDWLRPGVMAVFGALLASCGGGGSGVPVTPLAPSGSSNAPVSSVNAPANISVMSSWLSTQQRADGAILYTTSEISPYFANLAATGWAKSSSSLANVQAWMRWYVAHLNATDRWGLGGTIYDYTIDASGNEVSAQNADSTDAYAATFLSLARALYDTNDAGSQAYIRSIAPALRQIANVLIATQTADGMTVAKPDYPVEYLMDNTEVYRGLRDMAYLSQSAFADPSGASTYASHAALVANGIATLWNAQAQAYAPSRQGSVFASVSWTVWYPDATSQLFPIVNGVLAPSDSRAQGLYATFNRAFPGWDTLATPDGFPWALAADAAAIMGDSMRTSTYVQAVAARYGASDFPWPWYCAEGGWYMRANNQLENAGLPVADN